MAKKPAKKAPAKAAKKPVKQASKPVKKAPAKKAPVKKASKPVVKKAVAKKPAVKKPAPKKAPVKKISKPVAKKAAPKKLASKVKAPAKKAPVKAAALAKKAVVKKAPAKKAVASSSNSRVLAQQFVQKPKVNKNLKLTPFLTKQHKRLLDLKDMLLDSMSGVARGNLHAGSETSAFGMHQADAGSDAYDRDFALSMLSKEQGSLYEIDEALKRIEDGSYGVCELCQKPIKHDRLEALPFTRYTVDCQAELEKRQHHHSVRPQINSLFGLTEEEEGESEEEETTES
ncbi:MAG: molecular chaperone DnaK [Proteobacteria bacterium]|jgi:RNA polymerase-binding transcription factor DksA|nr:molecular chaperone DnaK [Pseudomonadota bacterium]